MKHIRHRWTRGWFLYYHSLFSYFLHSRTWVSSKTRSQADRYIFTVSCNIVYPLWLPESSIGSESFLIIFYFDRPLHHFSTFACRRRRWCYKLGENSGKPGCFPFAHTGVNTPWCLWTSNIRHPHRLVQNLLRVEALVRCFAWCLPLWMSFFLDKEIWSSSFPVERKPENMDPATRLLDDAQIYTHTFIDSHAFLHA